MKHKVIGCGYMLVGIGWLAGALFSDHRADPRVLFHLAAGAFFVTAGVYMLRRPRNGSEDRPPSIR